MSEVTKITEALTSLNYLQYLSAFTDNGLTDEILKDCLSQGMNIADDLKDVIPTLGHRLQFVSRFKKLVGNQDNNATTTTLSTTVSSNPLTPTQLPISHQQSIQLEARSESSLGNQNQEIMKIKDLGIPDHGTKYSAEDQFGLSSLPQTEINILLLGETGVGKSTWINGIANYLKYGSLEEALEHDILALIPSEFTMTTADYKVVKVKVGGKDPNEVLVAGQSATQHPTSYTFQTGNTLVRLIDTPGIGDTRGIEQDKINFQNIMNHLRHVDVIHGICILLKPNNSRISILFEFCIKELLTHLHRDAAANIAFCFTNARSTFYRPGDTLTSLTSLLTDEGRAPSLVPLGMDTIYCLDNEAFRFLAAVKHGEKFKESEKANFSESWKISVEETGRMMQYFQAIRPHETKNTVTLNTTRQVIIKLAKPLAEITKNIQTNIAVLDDRVKEINDLYARGKDLQGKLKIPQVDLQPRQLDYPMTVCADAKCTKKISVYDDDKQEQIMKTNYVQICHDHCHLTGVTANELNCAELQNCTAMNRSGKCNECGHRWEIHMHITYEVDEVMIETTDQNVASDIKTTEDRIAATQSVIRQCEDRKRAYEKEQDIITKTAAQFAVFLKENSITPYNNAIIRYLEHMIQTEQEKVQRGGVKTTAEQLIKLKGVYEEEERVLLEALKTNHRGNISLDTIQKSLKALYDLPLTGQTIKNLLQTAEDSDKLIYKENPWSPSQMMQAVLPFTAGSGSSGLSGFFRKIFR